jgi:hypothetical protein
MKIKVTTTAPKETHYFEGDDLASGLYVDAERDLCLFNAGTGTFIFFYTNGEFDVLDPIYPLIRAPKGSKVEISA